MNAPFDAPRLHAEKFGIGQPVSRKEDPVLLRGEGRYTDDVGAPGQLHAVIVRSRYAHGRIVALDVAEARSMPGVHAVITGAELIEAGYGPMPAQLMIKSRDGSTMHHDKQPPFTVDRVRYVGDPVACVVAETMQQARDAAEAVLLDVETMPAVTSAAAADAAGAPLVHAGVAGNLALDFLHGDAARVAEAFARAAHVTRLPIRNSRLVVCTMEPRAALAQWDAAGERWTLQVGCQGVFGLRASLMNIMHVAKEKLHILSGHIGGSFGMKANAYPEYVVLLHAARTLGRPVKWADARSDSFVSDSHGRDHEMLAELALDAEGHFLAVRLSGHGNLGAYPSNAATLPCTSNAVKNLIGVYRTPAMEVATRAMFTNTTPVGPYRGAGRPEGNYYMERLVDLAAAETGIDRIELRRRNHIRAEEMPWAAPSGANYDSGEFSTVLDKALTLADVDGFAARRTASVARGRLRGLGIGQYLEVTANPASEMGGIRFDEDGGVTIITGTLDYGQGHASPFAQVLVDKLGVPFERVRLIQGDSDLLVAGGGTGGSKSIMASGGAIFEAGDLVIAQGRQIAAHLLEAAVADIEFSSGRFVVVGTDRAIGIMELAQRLREGVTLPPDLPHTLDVTHIGGDAPSAYPNGCHIAEVEIDPETGIVEVVRYTMVNDFGVLINPMLVEGQAHGGIVQGIGQALLERTVYDEDGQLVSGSFMDYALPHADDAPSFVFASHPVPATTNHLGAKGCGEAGCAGALPSVMNAVVDALSEFGIKHIDMPATPERVWSAIQAARKS